MNAPIKAMQRFTPAWFSRHSIQVDTGVLCESCLRMFIADWTRKESRKVEKGFHSDASSLLVAVAMGCRICTFLWNKYLESRMGDVERYNDEDSDDLHVKYVFFEGIPEGVYSIRLSLKTGSFNDQCRFLVVPSKSMYTPAFASQENFKIDEYPIVPQTVTECYEMGLNTASTACWTLARDWISMCLTSHTQCRKTEMVGRFLPTRLIDVMSSTDRGNELRICSIGNKGIRRPYLTLSHR